MDKEDARKQPWEVLHERRKQVIRMHRKGVGVMKIVEQTGMCWSAVNAALRLYEAGAAAALKPDVRCRSYAPRGQTPVTLVVGGTREKLSMISTVTNQGKTRWMTVEDAFNSDNLIEFLEALIKDAGRKVFLILDNLRVHHSNR